MRELTDREQQEIIAWFRAELRSARLEETARLREVVDMLRDLAREMGSLRVNERRPQSNSTHPEGKEP